MKKAEPPTELSLRVCSKRLNDDSPSWSSKTYCVPSGIIQSVQGLLGIRYRSVVKGREKFCQMNGRLSPGVRRTILRLC